MSQGDERLYDVAIVGMAGRFPGAESVDAFWENLKRGAETLSFFTAEELEASGIPRTVREDPRYVPARGVLEGADLFDASFFGLSAREARILDPQQRIFLESAWEALENAGCDPGRFEGAVGVYAGMSQSTYLLRNLLSNPAALRSATGLEIKLGNGLDFLATQISYRLNLRGPSVNVATACSTSLVAVHLACQGLLNRECDVALAGGVSVSVPQKAGYLYQEGGIYSADGHCRTFDAGATGSLGGDGVGILVLKRLEDALRDGDAIRAVIRGSAINNDGSGKVGFSAPSVEGQAAVITEAQTMAGIDPDTVTYVEAHGSGTPLGDPVEIRALARAFRAATERTGFCAVGSVKTNFGHLDAAAGVAGLIKTVLALEKRLIPPSLHFTRPNPEIPFEETPFYVATRLMDWRTPDGVPRRAGVNSFGMGGTNAHVVLEEAPETAPSTPPARPWSLLTLSAATPAALESATERLALHLRHRPELDLADVAYTLQTGRRPLGHRRTLVCRDLQEAVTALLERDPRRLLTGERSVDGRPVAFLLPGLGDHYPGMARGLYESERVFRREVDRCAGLLAPILGLDLRERLFPQELKPAAEAGTDLRRMLGRGGGEAEAGGLESTALLHPAIFVLEYALARLWRSWGVKPGALLGYSLGEYTAACLAGVFSLEDGLRLVAERARLLDALPAGAMLAVSLPEEELGGEMADGLALAAVNSPDLCVVAGAVAPVEALRDRLARRDVSCRLLPASRAFHSAAMAPAAAELERLLRGVELRAPQVPLVSNVTGTWITAGECTSPEYWVRHLAGTVRFAEGLKTLWSQPALALLEVGPGHGLTTLALQQAGGDPERVALPTLRPVYDTQPDGAFLLGTLGRLWLAGVDVHWPGLHAGERRRKVSLPSYPFQRQRHWIEPGRAAGLANLLQEETGREGVVLRTGRNGSARETLARVRERGEALRGVIHEVGGPDEAEDLLALREALRSGEAGFCLLLPRSAALEAAEAIEEPPASARPELSTGFTAPRDPLEERVAAIWREILALERVGVHDRFFELGGHSLLVPRVLLRLREDLGVELPLARFLEDPTVEAVARAVARLRSGGGEAIVEGGDLASEVALDPAVRPELVQVGEEAPRAVLLTGATGFLGAHLLRDLQAEMDAEIHCLVRAQSREEGLERILRNLDSLRVAVDPERIVPVPGDLARPFWGLSEDAFRALAGQVGAVYHCGAWVNFTYPYEALKAANVGGTVEAARLASLGRVKPLHFVSTVAVFAPGSLTEDRVALEDAELSDSAGLAAGYPRSKWVAEKVLGLAAERGLPVSIYRSGVIAGDTATGIGNTRDLIWSFLKGCIQMGAAPELGGAFDPVPADYVSRGIVRLSRCAGGRYHFVNQRPMSWPDLWAYVRSLGYRVRVLPGEAWRRELARIARSSGDNALVPFWPLLRGPQDEVAEEIEVVEQPLPERRIRFDCHNTLRGLAGSGIECPPVDERMLGLYFGHFLESGYLPPPVGEGEKALEEILR